MSSMEVTEKMRQRWIGRKDWEKFPEWGLDYPEEYYNISKEDNPILPKESDVIQNKEDYRVKSFRMDKEAKENLNYLSKLGITNSKIIRKAINYYANALKGGNTTV